MKKILSTIIVSALMLSQAQAVFAAPALVSEAPVVEVKTNEPTAQEMEEMIKRVRPLFDVPQEYKTFAWSYSAGSIYSAASWRFTWSNDEVGRIRIFCDDDGRIYYYSNSVYNRSYSPALPTKSPSDFEETARQFVEKIAPYTKDLSFVLTSTSVGHVSSPSYTYTFTRYENDIPVPNESVSVTIDAVSGQVTYMNIGITNGVEFTKPESVITEEKAKQILSTTQKMKLSYRLSNEYDDDGNLTERKAFLVYTPELSYVSVDAVTGEIYTQRNTWEVIDKAPTYNGSMSADKDAIMEDSAEAGSGVMGRYELTEEEQAQLEVLKQLISREDAIKAVTQNGDLYIIPEATIVKANLAKRNYDIRPLTADGEQAEDKYVWNIEFTAPDTGENAEYSYYHSMSAVVDAKTGELISFNASTPDSYYYKATNKELPKFNFDEEKANGIALNFIKKMQPEKADSICESPASGYSYTYSYIDNEDGTRTPIYGGKDFRFNRINEGIEFIYNSFSVGVEYATGKITQYSYTWYDDVIFESPSDAIGEDEALMALYSYDGFGINYEVNAKYSYNEYLIKENAGEYIDYDTLYNSVIYTRPVYSAYALGTNTIRALDGKMIYSSGEEYVKYDDVYSYSDIEGHWAEETIKRLSYVGFGIDGGKYEPDKAIDGELFVNLCNAIGLYNNIDGLIELESMTRMDAVKYFITCLGYDKVACLENVFITDFVDNSDFTKEDVGFAAIARGFGLIEGDGENFRPYDTITRAEAAKIAENMIDLNMLAY